MIVILAVEVPGTKYEFTTNHFRVHNPCIFPVILLRWWLQVFLPPCEFRNRWSRFGWQLQCKVEYWKTSIPYWNIVCYCIHLPEVVYWATEDCKRPLFLRPQKLTYTFIRINGIANPLDIAEAILFSFIEFHINIHRFVVEWHHAVGHQVGIAITEFVVFFNGVYFILS